MVSNGKGVLKDKSRIYEGNFSNGKPMGEILVKSSEEDEGKIAIFKNGKFSSWKDDKS